ncbi:MAG TPA: sigma-70 family RNA polymerase sigma factor [Planctomycetota bacterium]
MTFSTSLGTAFPGTRWSVIESAGASEGGSLEDLARLYWRPIYAYARRKWGRSHEDAKDLVQDFFAGLSEKRYLDTLRPENGRFRSYVMAVVDNLARAEHRRSTAQKRGGGARAVALEDVEPAPGRTPEEAFLRDWAEAVLRDALEELKETYLREGRDAELRIFLARDVEGDEPSYAALAEGSGLPVSQVTHALFFARTRLRELVLGRVRETVGSARDAELEMRRLFG